MSESAEGQERPAVWAPKAPGRRAAVSEIGALPRMLRGWDEGAAGELNTQRVGEDFLEVGLVGDPALVGPGLELVEHPDGHTQ